MAGHIIHVHTTIPAPPEQVWDVITDVAHADQVLRSVSDTELLACGGNRGGNGLTVVEDDVALVGGFVTAASANQAAGPYFAILRVRTSPLEGLTLP